MIGVAEDRSLSPIERHALSCLIDASGLVPVAPGIEPTVRMHISDGPARRSLSWVTDVPHETLGDDPRAIHLPRQVVREVADILGMHADEHSSERDRHGRPPSGVNALVRAGAERRPVISLLARTLRDRAIRIAGERPMAMLRPWPGRARWAAALTHDLDIVAWWPLFTMLRLAELGRRGHFTRAGRVAIGALRSFGGDPVGDAIGRILRIEDRAAAKSTWFILCGTPTLASFAKGDLTYRPESAATRAIVAGIASGGHEIGLHGSLETVRDGAHFGRQRARLAALGGTRIEGVRQHFLRRVPQVTERAMAEAGFDYDSTTGFADRSGFRAGIADVHPAWDEAGDRAMGLDRVPFCWMDRALSKYQGVEDPFAWIGDAQSLAAQCASVEGIWCGIWHPNLATPLGFPDALDAYAELVQYLAGSGAWLTTLGDAVRWRRARRSVRVIGVDASGSARFAGDRSALDASPSPLVVELPDGRALGEVLPA